jgi:hypothetical protein
MGDERGCLEATLARRHTRAAPPSQPTVRVPLLAKAAIAEGQSRVPHREDNSPEPERRPDDRPPGQFVTDELQTDCSRFLQEIKEVVRRRIEAGLSRQH